MEDLWGTTRWKWILQTSRTILNQKIEIKPWENQNSQVKYFEENRKKITTIFSGSGGEIYTVWDEESESEVENLGILHPDLEIKEKNLKI